MSYITQGKAALRHLHPSAVRLFWERHERWLSPATLLSGFIVDNLTLSRIDLLLDNLILFSYLTLAGLSILLRNAYDAGRLNNKVLIAAADWTPLSLQYAFGGLFSGYVIFYTRSASLVASWPFVLFLTVLLVGNELFKKRYERLRFQIGIFFIAAFSFSIFFVPIVLNRVGTGIFLLSGLVSLVLTGAMVHAVAALTNRRLRTMRKSLFVMVGVLYLFFNGLYFANVIPPLPLALKDSGVYHRVEREGSTYTALEEHHRWYQALSREARTVHLASGSPLYSYSTVFAPTDINTTILHRWAYYSEVRGAWEVTDTIAFPIFGGRDGGYRGYSLKQSIPPGLWRVDVITRNGSLLGRKTFEVVRVATTPTLTSIEL